MRTRRLAWVIALAGCTSDADGPTGHGTVTVQVSNAGKPIAGATVVFHGPAGTVLGTGVTDPDGNARGDIDIPGMVTVIDPANPQSLTTIADVRDGETLAIGLGRPYVAPTEPPIGMLTISAPSTAPPVGTDGYNIQTPCWGTGASAFPATIPVYAGCAVAGVPVVITAQTPPGSLEDPGHALAYVAGMTDAAGNLAPGAWSTSCAQVDVKTEPEMSLILYPRFGGTLFHYAGAEFCALATPPAGYTAQPVLDFGEGALAYGFSYLTTALRQTSMLTDYASLPSAITVEQSADMLVGNAELTRLDAYGAVWNHDAALDAANLVRAKLTWILGQNNFVTWRFIVPNRDRLVVPELPEPLDLRNPTERIAELHFLATSWTTDASVLHGQLATLDELDVPASGTLREYTEQFYPDSGP